MGSVLKKVAILLVVAVLVVLYVVFDVGDQLSFRELKARQAEFQAFYRDHAVAMIAGFFLVYVASTALSLPIAAVLTIAGGAIFGLWRGVLIVSFASTIGATLAFLVARFVLRDTLQRRYRQRLAKLDEGVKREGKFYLFTMRLIPAFPFWLINLGMGVTGMRVWNFFWVSQLGMLPGTIVYVNAGTQLSQLESVAGILSPELIGSFVLLGLMPLISKKVVDAVKRRKYLGKYAAPTQTDFNVVVIGAGSGGLVTSYIAAAVKAKVALVEKGPMGGDCLNTGCVPSKSLLRTARFLHDVHRHEALGVRRAEAEVDFGEVMDRVHRVIGKVAPHDSIERYTELGVECIRGEARIVDPYTVEVNGQRLTTRTIVIATGAKPLVPPIPGVDEIEVWTSENLWRQRDLPQRLCVVGGGPIGSEMAQAFRRLGSSVVQVEAGDRIMNKEDPDISAMVHERFEREGIDVRVGHKVAGFAKREDGSIAVTCETDDGEVVIGCDRVLMALGRQANVSGYGLEELGVTLSERKTIGVDEFLRTNFPNIFAVGDVAGPYQFTHFAAHQAWYAAVNALFSPLKTFKADYSIIPWCTYTDPEVAHVGLSEEDAKRGEIAYEVTTYGIDDLDRAMAEEADEGVVKVLTPPGKDTILGVTIVGPHAGDLLAEFILAMKNGIGLNKILGTIHPYPTLAEANKYAAGAWKRDHKPEGLLRWVERYHALRRSKGKTRLAAAILWGTALTVLLAVFLAWKLLMPGAAPATPGQPREAYAEQAPAALTTTFDGQVRFADTAVEAYAAVLERVVDAQGRVDYPALVDDHAQLLDYYRTVAHLDRGTYASWSDDRQLAFWINTYNALVLLEVVEHYPIGRSLFGMAQNLGGADIPAGSIRNIPWVFQRVEFTIMGSALTLDAIEHEIIRPRFAEPRIHFAINCASVGCPPLRAQPFRGDELEAQLADQTRRFLREKPATRVVIDREAGTVELNEILAWFAGDFVAGYAPAEGYASGGSEAERAVLHFVAGSLPEDEARYLRDGDYEVSYRPYDWHLNAQPREDEG